MSKLATPDHPNDGGFEKKVPAPPRIKETATNNGGYEARVTDDGLR